MLICLYCVCLWLSVYVPVSVCPPPRLLITSCLLVSNYCPCRILGCGISNEMHHQLQLNKSNITLAFNIAVKGTLPTVNFLKSVLVLKVGVAFKRSLVCSVIVIILAQSHLIPSKYKASLTSILHVTKL